jgi:uncharacterized membrane protein YphA (DoxX/SURF4 family)
MLSFPAAWVGAALLVLRVVVGASTIIEAALAGTEGHATLSLAVALALAVAGLALVLGYLTPLVSALIAATAAVILLGFDATILHLLASRMALFEFAVMAAVVSVLGPGAISIDARLFGRREVQIDEAAPRRDL